MAEPSVDRRTQRIARPPRPRAIAPSLRARLLRTPPLILLGVAIVLVIAGQLVEDIADSAPLQLLEPTTAVRRWTLIVAVVYMLVVSHAVDRYVQRSLATLDAVVHVAPARFAAYAAQMRRPGVAVDAVLIAISAVAVAALFWGIRTSLPIDDPVTNAELFVPAGLGALVVLLQYTVIGWAVLTLVYCTIRRARALGSLSRERLDVDVFDTSNLLPLGNIALATALAPAGIVIILLFGFGRPTSPVSWTLLLGVTVASLLALLLPLRGIHHQMEVAKEAALGRLNAQLRAVYDQVNADKRLTLDEAATFNNRTSTLVNLRKTVGEMTTWPFRDTIAFGRAVLIATAPLIYTVINELIKIFFINPLAQ
jgi:hypothetical protein